MKIFLSYPSPQRPLAEQIHQALEGEGHSVFFDRESLPPGETFHEHIREAIRGCQLFVFLVSPAAIDAGSYTLTELAFVEELDEPRRPALLPILTEPVDFATLPPFLAARTVYQPRGNVTAEVAAQVERIQSRIERPVPQLLASRTNQGWQIHIDLAGEQPQEIFYRLEENGAWSSTGLTSHRSFTTGKPMARTDLALFGKRSAPQGVFIKYTDASGREQGPYRLTFDPLQSLLRDCREALRSSPWVSFREYPEGHLLVYFTSILTYKDVYAEVRYSVDDESLSRKLRFEGDPSRLELGIGEADELFIEVPLHTRYVCVKLHFVDGSATEVRTFSVAELGVSR